MDIFEIAKGRLNLTITADGHSEKLAQLTAMQRRVRDWRPFWTDYFAPKFYGDVLANFESEGEWVFGWQPLSPSYAAWKDKHFPGQPILVATGALKAAATDPRDTGAIFAVSPTQVVIGVTADIAGRFRAHQDGTGHLPARPIVNFDALYGDDYIDLLYQWLNDYFSGDETRQERALPQFLRQREEAA